MIGLLISMKGCPMLTRPNTPSSNVTPGSPKISSTADQQKQGTVRHRSTPASVLLFLTLTPPAPARTLPRVHHCGTQILQLKHKGWCIQHLSLSDPPSLSASDPTSQSSSLDCYHCFLPSSSLALPTVQF